MSDEFPFEIDNNTTPEKLIVQVFFHFSVLIEYQLNDLQSEVRRFVAMSNAIQQMDGLVETEAKSAQSLFETLFSQKQNEEGSKMNNRANKRAEDIFVEALQNLHPGKGPLEAFNSDPNVSDIQAEVIDNSATEASSEENTKEDDNKEESSNKIWSDVAKKFESFCRLEERLRPQVYTMIQSLNFEDIQTQRIEHALSAQKALNDGIVFFLKKGISNCSINDVKKFADDLFFKTKNSYTMREERNIFEQVFLKQKSNP